MTSITQKEYLKKYLGIGKNPKEKKKKKRDKTVGNRLKIVDEDLDVAISHEIQDDLSAANEDAPQIVAVIDDRPPSLRIDEETKSNLWKPIGEISNLTGNKIIMKMDNSFKLSSMNKTSLSKNDSHQSFKKPYSKQKDLTNDNLHKKYGFSKNDQSPNRNTNDRDISPPRSNDRDYSPTSKQELPHKKNKDLSPPRAQKDTEYRKREDKYSSPSRTNKHIDLSPPRANKSRGYRNKDIDNSPPRKNNNNDLSVSKPNRKRDDANSPPRRTTNNDLSPPRRNIRRHDDDPDNSPPRKNTSDLSPSRIKIRRNDDDSDNSPPRKNSSDLSPPRRKYKERDFSPARKRRSPDNKSGTHPDRPSKQRLNDDRDNSPPRKISRDLSPPRRKNRDRTESPRSSLASKVKKERESPEHKQRKSRWAEKSPPSSDVADKIEKTLSGKRAGLQDARGITQELMAMKEKEDDLFRNMSDEISGANAVTIVRGKKPVDLEEQAIKKIKEKEMKEKYDRWGKGLKQVDDQNQKFAEQLHEMNKPLARYADDEDLEKYLKDQEREGDPMLAYIRKKKRKKAVETGVPGNTFFTFKFMFSVIYLSQVYLLDLIAIDLLFKFYKRTILL